MTHAEALAELAGIITAAGVRTTTAPGEEDPPVAVLFSDGGDMRATRRDGAALWAFRVVCVASSWDTGGASDMLAATVGSVAGAIWAAPGWTLDRVNGDRSVHLGGAVRLAADVFATHTIQL